MWEALDMANYYRLGHLRRFVPTSNWSPRPPYGRRLNVIEITLADSRRVFA